MNRIIKYLKNLFLTGSDGQGNQSDTEKVTDGVKIIGRAAKKRQKAGQKAPTVRKKKSVMKTPKGKTGRKAAP